jgi:hypothetical protein
VIKGLAGRVNFSTRNKGGNVCVDVTATEVPEPYNSPATLFFWFKDRGNSYFVSTWADGGFEVARWLEGKYSVVFTTGVEAIKQGVGQTNHIELRLEPEYTTVFVNGVEVTRLPVVQPTDGGAVGFSVDSPENKPATFAFDNFVVSPPAE